MVNDAGASWKQPLVWNISGAHGIRSVFRNGKIAPSSLDQEPSTRQPESPHDQFSKPRTFIDHVAAESNGNRRLSDVQKLSQLKIRRPLRIIDKQITYNVCMSGPISCVSGGRIC